MRAKFEALETAGGKSAVKKAIEKKQKKVNQKEKKRRPFSVESGRGGSGGDSRSRKRSRDGLSEGRIANKRQRFS